MNKIYKTIRNALTGKTAVASELVKSRGKTQSKLSRLSAVKVAASPHNVNHKGSYLQLTMSVLITGLSLFAHQAYAEDITFDNDPSLLAANPFSGLGQNDSLFPSSNLTGNTVRVINGTISGNVYGGVTQSDQKVSDNSVTISGGKVGNVSGGRSSSGNVENNNVTILGGNVHDINGGNSQYGNVSGNTVTISAGMISSFANGGNSYFGNVTNNTVIFSGGKIGEGGNLGPGLIGTVSGGSSQRGDATGNNAIISGGEVGAVYGGYSPRKNATGNTVTISGGYVTRWVYGGDVSQGNATDNTVTISGTPQFHATNTSIYGGHRSSGSSMGNIFSGNTLNFSAHPISVNKVANFQYYNFTLTPNLANTGIALITAQDIALGTNASNIGDGSSTPSTLKVVGIHSGNILNAGDQFILMQAGTMSGEGVGLTTKGIAQQGISLLYDVKTDVDVPGKVVTATILGCQTGTGGICITDPTGAKPGRWPNGGGNGPRVNPQLQALPNGYLAGAQLVSRGADMIVEDVFGAIKMQEQEQGLHLFAVASGGHTRYNSGSLKSNDFLFTGGANYQFNNLTVGAFVEGGLGNYDTYNSFYNAATVRGDGKNRYYGAGLLGRYDFDNGFYTDATIRFGQNSNKFNTHDIVNFATGQFASYDLKSNYVSAHIGTGYIMQLNDKNQLDLSAKYLYSTLGGNDVNVAGDNIRFERIDSHRVRLNATLNHQYSDTVTFNAGLGYEHEFDSKARATTYGTYSIEAPSVRGGTGIVSIGANIKPAANQRLTLDIKANAYGGKREGIGASIRVNYAF